MSDVSRPEVQGRAKTEYRTPELIRYGAVRELTHAGSGDLAENQQPANCSQAKNKKPCGNPSDPRVKTDVVRIGEGPNGLGLYLFRYREELRDEWGHGLQFGVMADEVERVMPEAVSLHPSGYRMVDYDLLGIDRTRH